MNIFARITIVSGVFLLSLFYGQAHAICVGVPDIIVGICKDGKCAGSFVVTGQDQCDYHLIRHVKEREVQTLERALAKENIQTGVFQFSNSWGVSQERLNILPYETITQAKDAWGWKIALAPYWAWETLNIPISFAWVFLYFFAVWRFCVLVINKNYSESLSNTYIIAVCALSLCAFIFIENWLWDGYLPEIWVRNVSARWSWFLVCYGVISILGYKLFTYLQRLTKHVSIILTQLIMIISMQFYNVLNYETYIYHLDGVWLWGGMLILFIEVSVVLIVTLYKLCKSNRL